MTKIKGPWKLVSTKGVYKNPWIMVREDKVIRPDGKDGIFGIVTMMSGVSVLPFDQMGNVYLAEQYRYAIERKTIEAFSGGIDGDESALEAAKRELIEEAGIIAHEWLNLGQVDPFTNIINSPNYLYLAKGLTFAEADPDGSEIIKVIKIPFEQAIEWVMDNTITHSGTATLILKAKENIKVWKNL